MKTYQTLSDGSLQIGGGGVIPTTHWFYAQAIEEVALGDAQILPFSPTAPTELRAAAKASLIRAIKLAGNVISRSDYLLTHEYPEAYSQACDYIARSYADPVPKMVLDSAEISVSTNNDAADLIKSRGDFAVMLMESMRKIRLQAAKAIEDASDDDDFGVIAQGFIDQIEILVQV